MKEAAAVALEVIELGNLDPPGEGTEHENRDKEPTFASLDSQSVIQTTSTSNTW
jgi:hypothetical protein